MQPNPKAYYGDFGGQFVPETLMSVLEELEQEYASAINDPQFKKELDYYLREFAGRPSPLYFAKRLSERYGARIYLKREDLNHTGAHKINNTVGQVLLAKRMGKTRVIAETGAGQHGVATASACAALGLPCEVYMGEEDAERQKLNVYRMKLLGARVNVVTTGARTLKNAINQALKDYATNCRTTHYVIGSVVGPHPFPLIVRNFQRIIGLEAREQALEKEGRLPDCLLACVGGGSNALGLFHAFIEDEGVGMIGVEAAGKGIESGLHCATLEKGEPGVLHGSLSYLLQTSEGQVASTHSVSAGLDYPGVGPEHSALKQSNRVEYVSCTDEEALGAFHMLSELEGIIPALEPSHALAYLEKMHARGELEGKFVVVCLSGRGDKDVEQVAKLEDELL